MHAPMPNNTNNATTNFRDKLTDTSNATSNRIAELTNTVTWCDGGLSALQGWVGPAEVCLVHVGRNRQPCHT